MNEFNRYKYHHKILDFLVKKHNEFSISKDIDKPKHIFTYFEIAEIFKISDLKALEILTELRDDKSVTFRKPNEYIASDKGYRYLKSNKYKRLNKEYSRGLIIKDIKDFIIIIVGVLTIYFSLFTSKNLNKESEEKLESIQSQLDSIKLEQTKIKTSQSLILNDSLFLK
jgi:hypothetical protein